MNYSIQIVTERLSKHIKTFFSLQLMQALATRLDSARVHCDEKATDYGNVYFANVVGSIMSLNLIKVECPQGFFLARFEIDKEEVNEGMSYNVPLSPRTRYLYRCCKFIL